MDKDEFLEMIFKGIKESLVNLSASVEISAVYCSGVDVSVLDKDNKVQTYQIMITPQN